VLRQRSYKNAEPAVADVLLLIEVAETSLRYDRVTKRPLYAEAGVPEYWIVDCGAESIELHRGPAAGGYRDVTRVTGAAEPVSPLAFPDVSLRLAEIFA
jgi:Uma2 family endonuclease